MSLLPVGIGSAEDGAYQIERSLRFDSSASAYMNRTPASAGNRKTWTWSGWVKRSGFGLQVIFGVGNVNTGSTFGGIYFNTDNTLVFFSPPSGGYKVTTQVFRDPSAWYHIVCAYDTTNSSVKLYVNGSEITSFTDNTNPSANVDGNVNAAVSHAIGRNASTSEFYLNGYLTEINFIDGQALTPSSFGEFNSDTGVWQPKAYSGSYGTNGFYLDFADNTSTTTLGYDAAGSNDWSTSGFSVTAGKDNDSLVDSPTRYGTDTGAGGEVRGNYATLNPLGNATLSGMTFSDGNLTVTTSSARQHILGTMPLPTTGKWYWECNRGNATTGYQAAGIALLNTKITSSPSYNYPYNVWGYADLGYKIENGVQTTGYTTSASTSDVWGFAFDADAGTLGCYLNNTLLFTILSLTGQYIPYLGTETGCTPSINFGQRPWEETCPSGFKALVTTNLPEPTIADGGEYFNTVLYTGTGSSNAITGVGFQPDLVWGKSRSNAISHVLGDVLRGNSRALFSDLTNAEDFSSGNYVASFDADGFTVNGTGLNTSGATYVAWNWKANGAGVSNTDGSITSTVSANTDSGFSIVTYTGDLSAAGSSTVGHGLGVAPQLIITKRRDGASSWPVQVPFVGQNKYLRLNETAELQDSVTNGGGTLPLPTSTTFGVTFLTGMGVSGHTHVAYCFAPVAGYSAFGSYTGNGSTDGPFVYTGFRPAFILFKKSSDTDDWVIYDTARDTYNVASKNLFPNGSFAEDSNATNRSADILSNGFKLRSSGTFLNGSGATFIYAAFAENPFSIALAR